MTRRINSSVHTAAISATLALTSPALAVQDTPPIINTSWVARDASTLADWSFDGESDIEENTAFSTSNGTFARTFQSQIAHVQGANAEGSVSHKSSISSFQIKSEATCRSDATGPGTDFYIISASNSAAFEAHFTVPVDTTASFTSRIEASESGADAALGGFYSARVEFAGTHPDGTTFRFTTFRGSGVSIGPDEHAEVIDIKANTQLVLKWRLSAVATAGFPGAEFAEGTLACELNLGDADGDGLLDEWEENGVDVDGDGTIDIDLPAIRDQFGSGGTVALGRKSLFVELDAHAGVPFDQDAIQMVREAFANAPVLNEDGSTGIDLIIMTDETDLVNQEYDGTSWPQAFDDEKALHFGTPALRALPNWETEIKPAYAKVFRYGIWGQTMFRDEDVAGGGTKKVYFSGKAELPGNDFFVAAGEVMGWYSNPALRTDALAGTLMHEFGHNLNLKHGGQDNNNYKPNYFSVMNYTFQLPLNNTAVGGRALSDAWFLDYASADAMPLDETTLREDDGLDGPAGMLTIFNTATDGNTPSLLMVDADSPEIDWDGSGSIETEPVSIDVTRFGGTEDELQPSLKAESDWDKLWYHLSGNDDFADGSHASSDDIEPFTFEQFTLLNTYPVIDLSTPNCPADLNGDGIADQGDIQAFITFFLVQDPAVDFNGDGIVDLGDIQAFIAVFLVGC